MQIIDQSGNTFHAGAINASNIQRKRSVVLKADLTNKLRELQHYKADLPSRSRIYGDLKESNQLQSYRLITIMNGVRQEAITTMNQLMANGYHVHDIIQWASDHKASTRIILVNPDKAKADDKIVDKALKQAMDRHQNKIEELTGRCVRLKQAIEQAIEQERLDDMPEDERLFNELIGGIND